MSDAARPSSSPNAPAYDYNDLAFYIKWARDAGTPDHALMALPRLAFLPPDRRRELIDHATSDPAYRAPRRSRLGLTLLCFFVGVPVSILVTTFAVSPAIDRWAVDRSLGPGTYDRGVRIADKHGNLTNGRALQGNTGQLRSLARGGVFFGSAVVYLAAFYWIFGDRKDKGPSLNGYRLHLLLRKPPPPQQQAGADHSERRDG